ncbi:hypothetical protein QBC35DRAFT_9241 [Podospora australis]|uniref:Uncharacterized protein n=1 Tax=Podospora australis TaxID=1536484 RepID=A0AAN6X5A9_9PEZI|nr:hypothetical protein QBC35DRAFT_9241 [Podospora australis]
MAPSNRIVIPRIFNYLLPAQGIFAAVAIYSSIYVFAVGSIPFILAVVAAGLHFLLGMYFCLTQSRPGNYHIYIVPIWLFCAAGVWCGALYYFTKQVELVSNPFWSHLFASSDQPLVPTWSKVGLAMSAVNIVIDLTLIGFFILSIIRQKSNPQHQPSSSYISGSVYAAPPLQNNHSSQYPQNTGYPIQQNYNSGYPNQPVTYLPPPPPPPPQQQHQQQQQQQPLHRLHPQYQQHHQFSPLSSHSPHLPQPPPQAETKPTPIQSISSLPSSISHFPSPSPAPISLPPQQTQSHSPAPVPPPAPLPTPQPHIQQQQQPTSYPYDPTNRIDILRRLCTLQHPDGHWAFTPELVSLIKTCSGYGMSPSPSSSHDVTAQTHACLVDICNSVWTAQREGKEHDLLSPAELASLQAINFDLSWASNAADRAAAWMGGGSGSRR